MNVIPRVAAKEPNREICSPRFVWSAMYPHAGVKINGSPINENINPVTAGLRLNCTEQNEISPVKIVQHLTWTKSKNEWNQG